jgi:predicted phage gp36 major capsid-like protein
LGTPPFEQHPCLGFSALAGICVITCDKMATLKRKTSADSLFAVGGDLIRILIVDDSRTTIRIEVCFFLLGPG